MSDSGQTQNRRAKFKMRAKKFVESGKASLLYTVLLLISLGWFSCWLMIRAQCLPGSDLLNVLTLILSGKIAGKLVSIVKIPPLVGMLAAGIMFSNVESLQPVLLSFSQRRSAKMRCVAFVIILLRAGLTIKGDAIRKNKVLLASLSVFPCIVEVLAIACLSKPLLDLPWAWAFLLGFVIAGVSPAVVIPGMLSLIQQGYGCMAGVPSLMMTASPLDNAFTISGYGIVYSVLFPHPDTGLPIFLRGPVELVVGTLLGLLIGSLIRQISQEDRGGIQQFILFFGGVTLFFGLKEIKFPGAGIVAVIVMGTFTAQKWIDRCKTEVAEKLDQRWNLILQSALFTLTGAQIKVEYLTGDIVGYGLLCLLIGLILRCAVAYLAVNWSPLHHKEKFFVCVSWIPKATAQAAIGSMALDAVRETVRVDPMAEMYGITVLCIAVLAIIVTAPTGAILISWLGPKFLDNKSADELLPLCSENGKNEFHEEGAEASSLNNRKIHSNGMSNHSNGTSNYSNGMSNHSNGNISNHSNGNISSYGLSAEVDKDEKKQP